MEHDDAAVLQSLTETQVVSREEHESAKARFERAIREGKPGVDFDTNETLESD